MVRNLRALAGPAIFFGAAIAGARRVPDYSHRDEPISALAAHGMASAPVMVPGFLGLAAGTIALGRSLRGSRLPAVVPPMVQLIGVGVAGAGLARCSDRSCPTRGMNASPDEVTRSDDLHAYFSALAFPLWIATPIVAGVAGTRLRAADRRNLVALGLATMAGAAWNFSLFKRNSPTLGGLSQRVTIVSAFAWYPVIARAGWS
jgi:hypothetical protein